MAGESSSSSSSSTERKLDQTPTWALAGLCAVMIIISISLEKTLHKLGTSFRERHKKALFEALEKVKSELMVLGFISLLLTFGQKYIAKICIPTKVADTMLPCPATETTTTSTEGGHQRRLLWYQHRILAADSNNFKCEDVGKLSLEIGQAWAISSITGVGSGQVLNPVQPTWLAPYPWPLRY